MLYIDIFDLPGGDPAKERARVQAPVNVLRSVFGSEVPVVFIPEAAPGNAGATLANHLVHYPAVLTLCEANKSTGALGVPATDREQQTWQATTMFASNAVHYWERLQSYPGTTAVAIEAMQTEFETQAMNWEKVIKCDESNPLAPMKWKWTGKSGGKNDDAFVTILMIIYWGVLFFSDPFYAGWRETYIRQRDAAETAVESEINERYMNMSERMAAAAASAASTIHGQPSNVFTKHQEKQKQALRKRAHESKVAAVASSRPVAPTKTASAQMRNSSLNAW